MVVWELVSVLPKVFSIERIYILYYLTKQSQQRQLECRYSILYHFTYD